MNQEYDKVPPASAPVRYGGLYDWMQSFVMMFLPLLFLVTFVGNTIPVYGYSMAPTLDHGERMLVRSAFYTPQRGDVIVFVRHDFADGTPLVKRVIALAGDVVDINPETGIVYLNGEPLDEPYISELIRRDRIGNIAYPHTVPEGHVFVIGDYRNNSLDSRSTIIGPVDEREIIGRAVAVILPLDRIRLLNHS